MCTTSAMYITAMIFINLFPMHNQNAEQIRAYMRPEIREQKRSLTSLFLLGLILGIINLLLDARIYTPFDFPGPIKLLPDSFVFGYLFLTLLKYSRSFQVLDDRREKHEKFDRNLPGVADKA